MQRMEAIGYGVLCFECAEYSDPQKDGFNMLSRPYGMKSYREGTFILLSIGIPFILILLFNSETDLHKHLSTTGPY